MTTSRWLVVFVVLYATSGAVPVLAGVRAAELRCEYRVEPLAVDVPRPRLGWILNADRRAEQQTAYRILVASSPERLQRGDGDLWDSGRVPSNATQHVEYGGRALASRQACWWTVRVWDRDGVPGPWSAPSRWETGLRSPDDWTAQWIEAPPAPVDIEVIEATYHTVDDRVRVDVTDVVRRLLADGADELVPTNDALGGDPAYGVPKRLTVRVRCGDIEFEVSGAEDRPLALPRSRIPLLRRAFRVDGDVVRARLYVTALGVYDLSLDGAPVGGDVLSPGWTDYRRRVLYAVHDVTDRLAPGPHVLGAVVAPGWYSGHAGLFNAHAFYGTTPALLAQLELTYADGRTERIGTDDTWRTHPGPWLGADLLQGETFDATASLDGWCTSAVDDATWTPASVRAEHRRIEARIDAPVRIVVTRPAETLAEPAPGRWTFDLGQNMVGVVRLRVDAPRGTVLTIRHAEMLQPDGTIYTDNLRGARATDVYVCRGGGAETWQPRFTFHGFRYVEVAGLPARPTLDTVTGVVLATDLEPVGTFECSDASINQLQSNIVWGLRGNVLSIPTDCPQRDERMGWTADAQVFMPTAAYNADVAAFLTKWIIDIADAQREDGAHADVAPVMTGLAYGTPAWGDAGVIVPWTVHQYYGDTRILADHADSMTRWVEWCRAHSTGLIRDHDRGNDYGDWLAIGADTPKDLIGTAYFAHVTDLLSRSLAAIGREEASRRYAALFDDIRAAFVARYVRADGRLHGDTQCAYVLALRFDLLPEPLRAAALRHLVADIEARGGHLSTGFVGVSHLLHVLDANGRADVAERLLLQDTFPSWLFSVKHGATTIWERWDGWTPEGGVHPDAGMNSFNHYALGSCGRWLFEGVAGIAMDPAHPGFGHVIIRPHMTGRITAARATYRSIRGLIATDWSNAAGRLRLSVTVPANVTATVFVPASSPDRVRESGGPIADATGVTFVGVEGGACVFTIGSGSYAFTVD